MRGPDGQLAVTSQLLSSIDMARGSLAGSPPSCPSLAPSSERYLDICLLSRTPGVGLKAHLGVLRMGFRIAVLSLSERCSWGESGWIGISGLDARWAAGMLALESLLDSWESAPGRRDRGNPSAEATSHQRLWSWWVQYPTWWSI